MPKSPDAFRTISEVADWLGIQAHVLRFWESKFTQVRPIKRAGGRRYYRPGDMQLLGGIKQLLHEDGLTIKGVQKILREEGMSHVATLSPPLDELTQSQMQDDVEAPMIEEAAQGPEEKGVVLSFDASKTPEPAAPEPEAAPAAPDPAVPAPATEVTEPPVSLTEATQTPAAPEETRQTEETSQETVASPSPPPTDETAPAVSENAEPNATLAPTSPEEREPDTFVAEQESEPEPEPEPEKAAIDTASDDQPETEDPQSGAALPAFPHSPMPGQPEPTDNTPSPQDAQDTAEPDPQDTPETASETAPEPSEPEPIATSPQPVTTSPHPQMPKPRIIDLPPFTPEHEIAAEPSMLSRALRTRHLTKDQARQILPLLDRLTILRDSMAAPRRTPAQQDTAD